MPGGPLHCWCFLQRIFGTKRERASQEPSTSLAALPRDVIELLCEQLCLRDRIALTSCCRALWDRADVLGNPVLWGPLNCGSWDVSSERKQRSLAAWLARRGAAGGLSRLRLHFHTPWYHLEGLSIVHSTGEPRIDRGVRPLLSLLQHAAGLRGLELRGLGLKKAPSHLTALTSLHQLSLRGNGALGRAGETALQPLQALTGLTRLDLRSCGLRSLPPQLSALCALADLDVSVNVCLSEGGPNVLAPLLHLHALTRLDISECGMRAIPHQLPQLRSLADLSFSFESPLEQSEVEACLAPLRQMAGLTRLDLSCSGADPNYVRMLVGPGVQLACW